MDSGTFEELIVELCEAALIHDVDDVDEILDSRLLMVSGLVVKLDYLPHADECSLMIELGAFDAGIPGLPLRLLQHNFDLLPGDGPTMALDEDSATVVASARIPIGNIHAGGELLDALVRHVDEAARAWSALRTEFTLLPDGWPSGVSLGNPC